jgi:hypothetical protein
MAAVRTYMRDPRWSAQLSNVIFFFLLVFLTGCQKEVIGPLPVVSTDTVQAVTNTTALVGGTVLDDVGKDILVGGICWATDTDPSLNFGSHTADTLYSANFSHKLTGLAKNTTYYVRAYATNSSGTAYGEQVTFTTLNETNSFSITASKPWLVKCYPSGDKYWVMELFCYCESNNTLLIVLPGITPPTESGSYSLTSDFSQVKPGTALLRYYYCPNWEVFPIVCYDYFSTNGTLQIDVTNGQVSATFNQIVFKEKTKGSLMTLSAHVTCP